VSSAQTIADKTLHDATALLTAALKELHLIIQQQLLDFLKSYGKRVMLVMQQTEIMCINRGGLRLGQLNQDCRQLVGVTSSGQSNFNSE
jgi:hypothetical protein